eukprot:TRINITY_DN19531_c0_g1_i2.p1 TRINITY_DN19531_c0_g1~~TRINITY_DN19531_c0_g1_i2.p1  ORF type:complete len:264 (+),score=74.80 TRINITY_DN19531_c0_g1_i2:79-870(+)
MCIRDSINAEYGKSDTANMPITLYTNPICPFAHRAALTAKLRAPPAGVEFRWIPLGGELAAGEKQGIEKVRSINTFWAKKSLEDLQTIKSDYKRDINPSGEVPTVVAPCGGVVFESEIAAEYLDQVGSSELPRLVPEDPLASSRMRLSMKKFNDVVGALYGSLMNKDPDQDPAKQEAVSAKLQAWEGTLDTEGPFSLGGELSLADVHAAPFLHRFKSTLAHHRGFDVLAEHPRASALLAAVEALPQFEAVSYTHLTLPTKRIV